MGNFARLLVINIIVVIILVGGGATAFYFYNESTNYVKTDNASIGGQSISIAAPASGKLNTWNAKTGDTYSSDETLGNIASQGVDGKPVTTSVKMPHSATVVQNTGVKNTFVAAGTQLAVAYDLDALYVTANVDETDIDDIKTGQKVDIYVDAYPNTTFTGRINQIGSTTSSTFSLLPSTNTNSNYTKVTQVIPVKVSIDNYKGVKLMPGMNVTVRIHI
ncbi:HlyD family secretion protein [Terrilactibacillus laevilacticus]|uniref:HlyD family secretion protein n=1 Tax=Terrilactibacillus laevilacticus TaxID=1380157 RepID=A0ABW5PQA3_9BACI|nr:HlyD family efflux transporter periplasmic adaptor subunit [Terrilactibacillus laevilacticus]